MTFSTGHNSTISSQPKCVNLLFSQFELGGMCPDTIQPGLPHKICEWGICTVLTWRNMSGHNYTVSSHPQCVNQAFAEFCITQMCLDTIKPFLARWIGIFIWVRIVQIPKSYIYSPQKFGYFIWTHFFKAELCKYKIQRYWLARNCGIVSGHIPLSPNCLNIQFTHFG